MEQTSLESFGISVSSNRNKLSVIVKENGDECPQGSQHRVCVTMNMQRTDPSIGIMNVCKDLVEERLKKGGIYVIFM